MLIAHVQIIDIIIIIIIISAKADRDPSSKLLSKIQRA